MANELKMVWGSATTVIDLTADLANGDHAGGTAALDNSTTQYPYALAVFNNPGTFGAAPTAGGTVNLYAVLQNTDSTADDTATPASTNTESARFMGAFPIYAVDEEQRVSINISLLGIQNALFYIKNACGQTITGTGNHIYVKVTPYTLAPAA